MIGGEWQFWVMGGMLPPGGSGPGCWHVGDWDQRRTISVTFENGPGDEDLAIGTLASWVCTSSAISTCIHSDHHLVLATSRQSNQADTCHRISEEAP